MNVLSLFDGIGCGYQALKELGIKVDNYYASEIDKYAMQIAKKNHPEMYHIGDVTKLYGGYFNPRIDLLIGGSPCQGFSFAGKQLNFEDPRSKLFFEYARLLKECEPKYFLLENVRMKQEYQDVISDALGVKPILINSSLVSAQNRNRLYWTNIPNISQPEDKGLVVSDIVEIEGKEVFDFSAYNPVKTRNYYQFDVSGKGHKSQQDRAYKINGKMGCLANARAVTKVKVAISDHEYVNMSIEECEDMQTVTRGYTKVKDGFSLNKSLSALGNGWTVDVIKHILKNMDVERTER